MPPGPAIMRPATSNTAVKAANSRTVLMVLVLFKFRYLPERDIFLAHSRKYTTYMGIHQNYPMIATG
jgi:hypothetical protein